MPAVPWWANDGAPVASFRRAPDSAIRAEYVETQQWLTELMVRLSGGPKSKGGKAALARHAELEAGGPAQVQGWQIGFPATDFSPYLLDGDGQVTPIDRPTSPKIARDACPGTRKAPAGAGRQRVAGRSGGSVAQ
jgi:hypothetical protein